MKLLIPLLLVACDPAPDSGDTAPTSPSWPDIDEVAFDAPVAWAHPIDDYIEINTEELGHTDFLQGVHELYPFEDRLYIGYGDANLNLGRITPIELRYWQGLEDPAAVAHDFIVDEEQVDHFRQAGDTLLLPGVDATEDDLLGNVYAQPAGGAWSKSRTLEYAWHVHDIAAVGESLYACGSGGTIEDYESSDVNAYVWRSDDSGETFVIDQAYDHPDPPGDNRFTGLLTVDDALHVFGYASDTSSINRFHAFTLGADGLEELAGLSRVFVTRTQALSESQGLLVGVSVGTVLTWRAWTLAGGEAEVASALDGITILDLQPVGDGRTLVLAIEGNDYPAPTEGPWQVSVGLTGDASSLETLVSWEADLWPEAVAYYQGSLLVGMADGSVWRAEGY
jgi:hypothetical protein